MWCYWQIMMIKNFQSVVTCPWDPVHVRFLFQELIDFLGRKFEVWRVKNFLHCQTFYCEVGHGQANNNIYSILWLVFLKLQNESNSVRSRQNFNLPQQMSAWDDISQHSWTWTWTLLNYYKNCLPPLLVKRLIEAGAFCHILLWNWPLSAKVHYKGSSHLRFFNIIVYQDFKGLYRKTKTAKITQRIFGVTCTKCSALGSQSVCTSRNPVRAIVMPSMF